MNIDNEMIDTILTLEDFAKKYAEEYEDGDEVVSVEPSCGVDLEITLRGEDGDEYTRTVDEHDMAEVMNCEAARLGEEDGETFVCGFNN